MSKINIVTINALKTTLMAWVEMNIAEYKSRRFNAHTHIEIVANAQQNIGY